MWRAQPARAAVIGVAIVLFGVCSVVPVAYLVFTSLGASQAYETVLLDARQRGQLARTRSIGKTALRPSSRVYSIEVGRSDPLEGALRNVANARFGWRTIRGAHARWVPSQGPPGETCRGRADPGGARYHGQTGQKRLVALQLAASEATTPWSGLLADLQR